MTTLEAKKKCLENTLAEDRNALARHFDRAEDVQNEGQAKQGSSKLSVNAPKKGVLLVNLGTPNSTNPRDVWNYLNEFLTDGRVIDVPWLWRQFLVRGWIVPRRYRASAALYRNIWTEKGSPLLLHTQAIAHSLQEVLGEGYLVTYAMRYGEPSLTDVLAKLQKEELGSLTILPLFPQYASATTGSVHARVMELISSWQVIPELRLIQSYPTHPLMIHAFAKRLEEAPLSEDEHLLVSFHGVPERHLRKADMRQHCLCAAECCQKKQAPPSCYRAQCMQTFEALRRCLHVSEDRYHFSFQSRLGSSPWTTPYTDATIERLAKQGVKRLAVMAPAFTSDCLETLDEIGREYAELFHQSGGEHLRLIPSLNNHPLWALALRDLVLNPAS